MTPDPTQTVTLDSPPLPPQPEKWAVVELMGHQRYIGRLSEVEVFGRRMGRVEALKPDGTSEVIIFGGQAVYRVTETTEAKVRAELETRATYTRALPAPAPYTRYANEDDDGEDYGGPDSDLEQDMADARGETAEVERVRSDERNDEFPDDMPI